MIKIALTLLLSALSLYTVRVKAHGQLIYPASRNFLSFLKGTEWCPHCLNAGGVSMVSDGRTLAWPNERIGSICGDRYGESKWDVAGPVQAQYVEGQIINVDFLVTENHLGRIDMSLCDVDAQPEDGKCTQLQRADGKGPYWYLPFLSNWGGGNPGYEKPAYSDGSFAWYTMPELAYNEGGCVGQSSCSQFKGIIVYRVQWQLPQGVGCKRCKLQWHYLTAHNCWPPCAPLNEDEVTCENVQSYSECGKGGLYPESFWNCADVRVINASEVAVEPVDSGEASALKRGKDLPPWEDKIVVSKDPWGQPRPYKMHAGGWRVMSITLNKLPEASQSLPSRRCGKGQAYDIRSEVCIGPCEGGKYMNTANAGSPRCESCKPGEVSPPGAMACQPCSQGTYPSAEGTQCLKQQALCSDGVRSGLESDVDCGQACARKCGYQQRCLTHEDCSTGACNIAVQRCDCAARPDGQVFVGITRDGTKCLTLNDMCSDGHFWEGAETDVDCGGPCPKKCAVGKNCKSDEDCATRTCNPGTNKCGPAPVPESEDNQPMSLGPAAEAPTGAAGRNSNTSCYNGVQDGAETDADCGGSCDKKCGPKKKCLENGDCVLGSTCDPTDKVCKCKSGYGGDDCQSKLTSCDMHSPCQNGQCIPMPGASPDYRCLCPSGSGFAGPLCEQNCFAYNMIPDPRDTSRCTGCGANAQFKTSRCVCDPGFEDMSGGSAIPECKPCGEGKVSRTAGSKCETCPGWGSATIAVDGTRPNRDHTQCVQCSADTPHSVLYHKQCGCEANYYIAYTSNWSPSSAMGGTYPPTSHNTGFPAAAYPRFSCIPCPAGCTSSEPMERACRDAQANFCAA